VAKNRVPGSKKQERSPLAPLTAEEALKPAVGTPLPSGGTVEESPESFEYRGVRVRRILRGAFSGDQKSANRYAWRARVEAHGNARSVSAESVPEIKEKIDAILDVGN
jgi:hypothetical protein